MTLLSLVEQSAGITGAVMVPSAVIILGKRRVRGYFYAAKGYIMSESWSSCLISGLGKVTVPAINVSWTASSSTIV